MEGLYNGMANNPISNIDFWGDITYYYDTEGKLIRSQNDGRKNATITVITEDNMRLFNLAATIIDLVNSFSNITSSEPIFSDEMAAGVLSATGVSYDTKEYEKYYDKHSKDYHTEGIFTPIDGKGKLVNEHMAGLELKSGYMRVMDRAKDSPGNNPTISDTYESGNGDIHTHPTAGRRFMVQGHSTPGTALEGKAGLGWDINRRIYESKEKYRKGILDVVVSPTHIYLYGNGQVLIAIDRKNVPSKIPGEIK
jgi:hypothetical protein